MKFCEQCGEKITNQNKFCENCGAKLSDGFESTRLSEETDTEVTDLNLQHEERPIQHSVARKEEPSKSPQIENDTSIKKSKSNNSVYILMGAAVLLLIGGGYYWWTNSQPNPPLAVSANSSTNYSELSLETGGTGLSSTVASSSETVANELAQSTVDSDISVEELNTDIRDNSLNIATLNRMADGIFNGIAGNHGIVIMPAVSGEADYYTHQENRSIRSASIMKMFIAAAFLDQVEKGNFILEDEYHVANGEKVGGTGVISTFSEENSTLSYVQLLNHLIVDSDNTAGNVLLNALGGLDGINKYLASKGYHETIMNRYFMDTDSLAAGKDNYTSAYDCAKFLRNIYINNEVSPNADNLLLGWLRKSGNKSKLPALVDSDITVYNKTGEYADYGVESDACIFEKGGKAYVVVVLSDSGNSSEQIQGMNLFGRNFCTEYLN